MFEMGDTEILKSSLMKIISFIIMVSLVCLSIRPINGYCHDWVYVEGSDKRADYYDASSVKIDKQNNIIEMWVKCELTEKGKNEILERFNIIKRYNYRNNDITLQFVLINYKEWKWCATHMKEYSKSGDLISDGQLTPEWKKIETGSIISKIYDQLLRDKRI